MIRIKILFTKSYNIEIDGRNVSDQPINDLVKQYDEVTKNFYRTRWWLHNWLFIRLFLFKKNYRLIAANLFKQKALDADSREIQQIIFTGTTKATVANTRVIIFYVLEKSKETILEFSKGTTKVL